MHSPTVSIIVPVYNSATTLDRCLKSILAQTFEDWELLLVDNGSSDNSYEIISNYAGTDNRIHALQEFKRGVSEARNTALDNAKGEYVCFIDSDDEVEKDYLEQLLKEPNADLTVCGYFLDIVTTHGLRYKSQVFTPERGYWCNNLSKLLLESVFANGFMHLCCNKLFRQSIIVLNNIRFQSYSVNEDYIFTLTFLKYTDSISIIDKPLYHWIRTRAISGVLSIPENILSIYNRSHLMTCEFFENDLMADKIAYKSYDLIIFKYLRMCIAKHITSQKCYADLRNIHKNVLVKRAFESYKPYAPFEKILYFFNKHGLFRLSYLVHKLILLKKV